MGEERINKVKIEDLAKPEEELTPEEAQRIQGGFTGGPDAARAEGDQKRNALSAKTEQMSKSS